MIRKLASRVVVGSIILFLGTAVAPAFNGHKVTEGPVTIAIEPIAVVTQYEKPIDVQVTVSSTEAAAMAVSLQAKGLVEPWKLVGAGEAKLNVPAKGSATAKFQIAAGRGAYSAHYPLHIHAAFNSGPKALTAHAILVYESDFSGVMEAEARKELPVVAVPRTGALALFSTRAHRVTWQPFGKEMVRSSVGWFGSDEKTGTSASRSPVARGTTKQAIGMHPPYRSGAGTSFIEYKLSLPDVKPIRIAFANAIRDTGPKEPPSDGVTFRVWADDRVVFERHTDSKTWVAGEADLSEFAGKQIALRLESHPGPKNNTTCDSCFWGDAVVFAGKPPVVATDEQRAARVKDALAAANSGKGSQDVLVFDLASGARAAVAIGPNGLVDGALAFADRAQSAAFEGLEISVQDQPIGRWPSAITVEKVDVTRESSGRVRIVHRLRMDQQACDLVGEIWVQDAALRVKVSCPQHITNISPARWDRKAERVYGGHAYAIKDPGTFRLGAGGHSLAASHVGFDFAGGLSMVVASDMTPDALQVDPPNGIYALRVHPDATLSFVPGAAGISDCVMKYRPLVDRKPASGVSKKAGRLVFDLWGGRYDETTAKLKRAFEYGVTDALVIVHAWQRWGYDYRLPDIYPPEPRAGTLEDLQEQGRLCAASGVLWGLHDNYIDFYPDAEGYSYDHITFNADGKPRKAWINESRNAQSYQFRPDRIAPFVQRNMGLIVPSLKPTNYFVDVFTSAPVYDYYDRDGKFHSRMETQKHWGEAMANIRQAMGNDSPVSSEAGSDQLIGYLDGADCQIIRLSNRSVRFTNRADTGDWDLVPWFDSVYHDKLSLHGVGYSNRYQGGGSRALRGIESDDYITAEMLTGHALMVDALSMVRGAVRKHWLAQSFIRSIAMDQVASFEMVGGDVHRVIVKWKSGAKVYVNRGATDWEIAGRVLPQYGFLATAGGTMESSIERIGGQIVERSHRPGHIYVNGRGFQQDAPLAIRPSVEKVEYTGGRSFKMAVQYDAQTPAPLDLSPFVHIYKPQTSRLIKTGFVAAMPRPTQPTSKWNGRVTLGPATLTIPEDCTPGRYDVLAGLVDHKARGKRYRLLGEEDSERRIRLGTLVVDGNKTGITAIRFDANAEVDPLTGRDLPNGKATDFGVARTSGALDCRAEAKSIMLTPLPDGNDFEVTLRLDRLLGRPAKIRAIEAVDAKGTVVRTVESSLTGQELTFTVKAGEFGYRVNVE